MLDRPCRNGTGRIRHRERAGWLPCPSEVWHIVCVIHSHCCYYCCYCYFGDGNEVWVIWLDRLTDMTRERLQFAFSVSTENVNVIFSLFATNPNIAGVIIIEFFLILILKMKLRELEGYLSQVKPFEKPKIKLEQYATDAHLAGK